MLRYNRVQNTKLIGDYDPMRFILRDINYNIEDNVYFKLTVKTHLLCLKLWLQTALEFSVDGIFEMLLLQDIQTQASHYKTLITM
jgi:hypothetical protein